MKVDNPLSREFILHYPFDAARVLEQLPEEHVAALFNVLAVEQVVPVLALMLPKKSAACLPLMPLQDAARLVMEMPIAAAARLHRFLSPAYQGELSRSLSDKKRRQLHRFLIYPPTAAGALVDSDIDILPDTMSVTEAIRYLKQFDHPARDGVYIINDKHQLVGIVDPGKLLISDLHARLRDIMTHKVLSISAHVNYETLLQHPGWRNHRRLPVVERDNTLVGTLHFSQLQEVMDTANARTEINPVDDFLSLAGLYWLSLAQFLDGVLSVQSSRKDRPGKRDHPGKREHQ